MRNSFRIANETDYQTKHLRKFVTEVAKQFLDLDGRIRFIRFAPAKKFISGWAVYHGANMGITLPNKGANKRRLAFVLAHEMAHWRGMSHSQMKHNPRYDQNVDGYLDRYSWADALPLESKTAACKPSKYERLKSNLEHARKMLKVAQTRAKRSNSILRKWQHRVKRLEIKVFVPRNI
jgi:hypothetical protein